MQAIMSVSHSAASADNYCISIIHENFNNNKNKFEKDKKSGLKATLKL